MPDEALGLARDAMLKAATLNPSSSDAFAWLAYAEMQRSDWNAAAKAIAQAIALAPGRLDFRLRQADVAILRGAINAARPMLRELAAITGDPAVADGARRRLEALDRAATRQPAARASVETPAAFPAAVPGVPRMTLDLRSVRAGEERAFGQLTLVECSAAQVRFHLAVGERTVVATAARLSDVELTQFTDTTETRLPCGPRATPDSVYLTWRMQSTTKDRPETRFLQP
jgi:hypothetical protein